jgi:hypothetical protein
VLRNGLSIVAMLSIALGLSATASAAPTEGPPSLDYQRALRCMAAAIDYEAGNEPLEGQEAVGQVILNRLRDPAYPKTVCGVVFQGSAPAPRKAKHRQISWQSMCLPDAMPQSWAGRHTIMRTTYHLIGHQAWFAWQQLARIFFTVGPGRPTSRRYPLRRNMRPNPILTGFRSAPLPKLTLFLPAPPPYLVGAFSRLGDCQRFRF